MVHARAKIEAITASQRGTPDPQCRSLCLLVLLICTHREAVLESMPCAFLFAGPGLLEEYGFWCVAERTLIDVDTVKTPSTSSAQVLGL